MKGLRDGIPAVALLVVVAACTPPQAESGEEDRRASVAGSPAERWMPALGEGFHRPSDLELPATLRERLRGVVRIAPDIRFRVTFHADRQAAALARGRTGAGEKSFLPEGGVLWPVHVDTASLAGLCENRIAAVQPGLREVCETDPGACDGFPCTRLSPPLGGSATGFMVGRNEEGRLLVATAWHVAREAVERAGRWAGPAGDRRIEVLDLEVGVDTGVVSAAPGRDGGGYVRTRDVRLLAHATEEGWEAGHDWALLSISAEFARHVDILPLAEAPPVEGDTVWTAGFPFVSLRGAESYPDAADELRVSFGTVVSRERAVGPPDPGLPPVADLSAVEETDLLSTVDGASGSSGSPVLDLEGRVVGILRDSTCKEGELDLRIARFCGLTLVVPTSLFRDAVERAAK